ncbi:MAG: helix-turn-helix domain-containing protein [Clostridia bacterium]|nr:helix-turn-helix domain-containing protein [Clostridia bacterium]
MLILITDRKELGHRLTRLLFDSGVYLYHRPLDTGLFFCHAKDTGGVLLDCVTDPRRSTGILEELQRCYPEMPVALLCKRKKAPPAKVRRLIIEEECPDIDREVLDFCYADCGWKKDPISTFYLTVSKDPADTVYMGYRLKLSPKETEILRFLFYRWPQTTSLEDLRYLISPLSPAKPSTVTVQIRNINLRAANIDSRPLIVNEYGKGYRLRDGIVI